MALSSEKIRNFVFGVEDSLVSTVGLVSGIAAAGVARETIILTGIILILVEAFSMAVGSLLSSNSAEEFNVGKEVSFAVSMRSAIIMFVSYIGAGIVIIAPYALLRVPVAFPLSIIISLLALFLLGVISATFSRTHRLKKGLVTAGLGGVAILLGSAVGFFLQ